MASRKMTPSKIKNIAVVSVGRSDYSILRPLLTQISNHQDLNLQLIVAGAHLVPKFGNTIDEILNDNFDIAFKVDMSLAADQPASLSRSIGLGCIGFANAYELLKPDLIFVLGDRFEMLSAAVAASPFLIPLVHHAGGSITEGAIDDSYRHCITKLSSFHFAETERHATRIRQMGECEKNVYVTGALGLDGIRLAKRLSRVELEKRFSLKIDPGNKPVLVTYHPVTRDYFNTGNQIDNLLDAFDRMKLDVIFSYPNADTDNSTIIEKIESYAANHPNSYAVPHFGAVAYYSMLENVSAIVGNSSSGIIEAATFGLPVINVGDRQKGRDSGENVINCSNETDDICKALKHTENGTYRTKISKMQNLYGDGHAAEKMIAALKEFGTGPRMAKKPFVELIT